MAQSYHNPVTFQNVTEFFTAPTMSENFAKMDERKKELERDVGATAFARRKIGRNATCPCGSLLKFKKCCLAKSR